MSQAHAAFDALKQRLGHWVVGQHAVIDRMLIALLADGHLLVEGMPGLAKTRAIKALAANLEATLSRIQFTPDLLPSDITGSEVYRQHDGGAHFHFEPGPVFANLILADEINRAPAKVQAALLEAMEERQVTVAGHTHALPQPFLVMATQNPVEQEGTYPLPEAQMDRFLMKVLVSYPSRADEVDIVRLVRQEEGGRSAPWAAPMTDEPMPVELVQQARAEVHALYVAPAIEDYIVDLVQATRHASALGAEVARWVAAGASPRASIALDRCARAHAWLAGRDHVVPADVQAVWPDCLRHRLILSYEALAAGVRVEQVLARIAAAVVAP